MPTVCVCCVYSQIGQGPLRSIGPDFFQRILENWAAFMEFEKPPRSDSGYKA